MSSNRVQRVCVSVCVCDCEFVSNFNHARPCSFCYTIIICFRFQSINYTIDKQISPIIGIRCFTVYTTHRHFPMKRNQPNNRHEDKNKRLKEDRHAASYFYPFIPDRWNSKSTAQIKHFQKRMKWTTIFIFFLSNISSSACSSTK